MARFSQPPAPQTRGDSPPRDSPAQLLELYSPGRRSPGRSSRPWRPTACSRSSISAATLPPGHCGLAAAAGTCRCPRVPRRPSGSGRGGADDGGLDLRLRPRTGPAGLLVDANRRISSLRSTRGCTLPRSAARTVRRREPGRPDGLQSAADGTGHRLARGSRAGQFRPCGCSWRSPNWACGCGCWSWPSRRCHGCRIRTRLWLWRQLWARC
jgi:hypothetical protein